MVWYKKYIPAYNTSPESVPKEVINTIALQLKRKQSCTPLVTICVIAYNEERNLLACLWTLSEMKCKYPVEIIGVNNNSSDRTEKIFQEVGIPYFNENRKGPGFARQCGLDHTKGMYHICIDADALYPPFYVETHLKMLIKKEISCTFSLWSFLPDQNHSKFGLKLYEFLRDLYLNFQFFKRPELCVRGMTFGFDSELAQKIGFRTDIKRGEDGSLALGLKKYGKIAFVRSRKARAVTGYGTLAADGSLINSFKVRFTKGLRSIPTLFSSKSHYQDEDSNLIDNSNKEK